MNTMENMAPNKAESNAPQEGILDMVSQIQKLEGELKTLKANQEELRQMPDRAEKNSLLGEIEGKIRETMATMSELQDKKMKLVQERYEKNIVKEPLQEFSAGEIEGTDPFDADPQSKADKKAATWRDTHPGEKL